MLSVKAIYDGNKLKFNEKITINTPHEVIVTFLDDPDDNITSLHVQEMAAKGGGLTFLDANEEDIYTDSDLKIKY